MEAALDPNKYHVLSPAKKRNIIIMIVVFVVIILPLISYFYYKFAVNRPSQGQREMSFKINKGDDVFTIANALKQEELINSETLFVLYVYLNKLDKQIQAGTYQIRTGTSLAELAEQFKHGTNDTRITFLEGWRVEQYAEEASKSLDNFDYKKFINIAQPYEGYLFPDTYYVNKEMNEEDLLDLLKSTFDDKTLGILTDSNISKTGLTKQQVVILASIVEREVSKESDRPMVAGILLKRLRQGMQLDADATVQYSVALRHLCKNTNVSEFGVSCIPTLDDLMGYDWWSPELTQEDIDFASPFNTRKNTGLPPSPISSVSISALESVINSKSSDYLYYLMDKNGDIHYARTLEEHNQNITKYLSQ